MNRPNQTVPSFVSVYLTANTAALTVDPILFNIVETDGSTKNIYDATTGQFQAPISGWYTLDAELYANLTELYIVKNGDVNFPVKGVVPAGVLGMESIRMDVKLGLGETLALYASGTVNALTGGTPNARASNATFKLFKRFDDTKIF